MTDYLRYRRIRIFDCAKWAAPNNRHLEFVAAIEEAGGGAFHWPDLDDAAGHALLPGPAAARTKGITAGALKG